MAAASTLPLVFPLQYDPSFKVDVRLHEPVLFQRMLSSSIEVKVASLCEQFDLLCRKELLQRSETSTSKLSKGFETKAMILLDRMRTAISKLPFPQPDIQRYFADTGLSSIFPRILPFIISSSLKSDKCKVERDDYFSQLMALYHVSALASQINTDLGRMKKHKYVAHQLALIYQSLGALSSNSTFAAIRADIQSHFEELKLSLNAQGADAQLTDDQQTWLLSLTTLLCSTVMSLPPDVTQNMLPVAQILTRS